MTKLEALITQYRETKKKSKETYELYRQWQDRAQELLVATKALDELEAKIYREMMDCILGRDEE